MTRGFKYLLGDSDKEVRRLAFQAKVWEDMTENLLDRLGVGPGWKCLEAGAGSGTVLFPLARRVRGRGGLAHAVERSPIYADYLRRKAKKLALFNVEVMQAEILDAPLKPKFYDFIFARWVFLFLPNPEKHLRRLAAALKPGGILAVEDYHRDGMAFYPRFESWQWVAEAERKWFASQGGDVCIAGRLPELMIKAGLEVREVKPWVKTGRPGSPVWKWAESFFLGFLDEIARQPPLTPARARKFRADWKKFRRKPGALFVSPAILDVVARKPR